VGCKSPPPSSYRARNRVMITRSRFTSRALRGCQLVADTSHLQGPFCSADTRPCRCADRDVHRKSFVDVLQRCQVAQVTLTRSLAQMANEVLHILYSIPIVPEKDLGYQGIIRITDPPKGVYLELTMLNTSIIAQSYARTRTIYAESIGQIDLLYESFFTLCRVNSNKFRKRNS
jgi:hypothetical protein